jgi:predicted HD superfamily hydrolase involved in NAD metabolism
MDYDDMVALVDGNVPDVTEDELRNEPVLHAPAGMIVAARDYGVKDPEILSAIRKHTVGSGGMTQLEKLIYTADFVEPNRKPFPGLEEARSLAETDLNAATKKCAQLTRDHVIACGGVPDARSLEIIEE